MLRLLPLLVACFGGDDGDDSAADTADTAVPDGGDTSADTGGDSGPPADPSPIVLDVRGAMSGSLVFDQPTCQIAGQNFRAFWRNAAREHVFVLIAEVLGPYQGPYTYTPAAGTVRVKLQEEAGGEGRYFATAEGTDVTVVVQGHTDTHAWGEFSFGELAADSGPGVTVEPQPVPIWCTGFAG